MLEFYNGVHYNRGLNPSNDVVVSVFGWVRLSQSILFSLDFLAFVHMLTMISRNPRNSWLLRVPTRLFDHCETPSVPYIVLCTVVSVTHRVMFLDACLRNLQ